MGKGQYEEAIRDITKALEINPKFALAYFSRGRSYYNMKEYDKSWEDIKRAQELGWKVPPEFLDDLRKASGKQEQIESKDAQFYNNRGAIYVAKGQYDQAISDFNKALEIDPNYLFAYNNRGTAYMNKDQYDQAISDFNKVLEIEPRYAGGAAYYGRAMVYEKKDQYDQAISDFNKAIEIDPKNASAYYRRGRCYYFKKEYNKSWEDVKKAQSLGYKISPEFLEKLRKDSGREK